MDLNKELQRIKDHFEQVSETELNTTLIALGINEISMLEESGFEIVHPDNITEKNTEKITYNVKNIYKKADRESYRFNVSADKSIEVA